MDNRLKPDCKKYKQNIFGNKKFLKKKVNRNIFSGLNTYNTYMNKKSDSNFLNFDESNGSLVSVLKRLSTYIHDISRIVPGGSYHDINLEARMNIKKYESLTVLSHDSQYDFKPINKNIIAIFQVVTTIYKIFIQIQDQLNKNLSGFYSIITKERLCIEQLYLFFNVLFNDYKVNLELLSSWKRSCYDYETLLSDCIDSQELLLNGGLSVEILDLLQDVNEKNSLLKTYLGPFFSAAAELDEQ
ncbi:MAG: hypothetical protein JEY99_13875 [Spirochaetales bacterium]|nr:hypothetical protein [Spirochaetales bacterium]